MFLQKPLGFSFGRGNDGGAYVTKVDEARGNIDEQVQVRSWVCARMAAPAALAATSLRECSLLPVLACSLLPCSFPNATAALRRHR